MHKFEFELSDRFFEFYPEGEVERGSLVARVDLYKQNSMLELNISIEGTVSVCCDRCLEMFNMPITYGNNLIIKFGQETNLDNDELWILGENEYEFNLAQYFYESVMLSIPISKYHGMERTKKTSCNAEMLGRINPAKSNASGDTIDPRWAKLKDLTEN